MKIRNGNRNLLFACAVLLWSSNITAQDNLLAAGNKNPLLPGYFADPTVKKFGDTFYIYSTTDGIKLASGQPTVWISNDFEHWYNMEMEMELPEGLTNCWAPDVVEGVNGKYYYYMGNCQFGCNIYGYESDAPVGPWRPIKNGAPVIPEGTGKTRLPALDAQFFTDDDGSLYAYFGTWCTSFGGMGWAKIDTSDRATILESGYIPIAQIPRMFEAAYMLKRNGKYILMYSSDDCKISTYAIHYAYADSPTGPFTYGANNPILSSNTDHSVDGPGHHSIFEHNNNYYMVYHRHDNPHNTGGMFRQVCVDSLVFENDTTIAKMKPTHTGVDLQLENAPKIKDIAQGTNVSASSYYHLVARPNRYNRNGVNPAFKPQLAIDSNNGTLWKAASQKFPQWLVVDLGKIQEIKRIATEFEYPTFYYQYSLEVSTDSMNWKMFADRSKNRRAGCPMFDDNTLNARYVKLTVLGTEKPGMFASVWDIRVYNSLFEVPKIINREEAAPKAHIDNGELLVELDAEKIKLKSVLKIRNSGQLKGHWIATGNPTIERVEGINAIRFDGKSYLTLSKKAPKSLAWNSPFTTSVWVYNTEVGLGECLLAWNTRQDMLQSSYAAMMFGTGNFGAMAHGDGATDLPFAPVPDVGKWHHIVVTFDGMLENVYVNGELNNQLPLTLFVEPERIMIGASGEATENFTGYIAKVHMYNRALNENEVKNLMKKTKPSEKRK